MRIHILLFFAFAFIAFANAQYPYKNPVIRTGYSSDPAPKVMPDGKVWMVTSIDHPNGGGYSTMHSYRAFSTSDMVNWTDHGEILNLSQLNEKAGEDWALWAPDIIYKQGKYYLYFPLRNIMANGNHDTYVAVAVNDRMDSRFTMLQDRMANSNGGLDPAVFVDDDGEQYIFWNGKSISKLSDDMKSIVGSVSKMSGTIPQFMEASWMHKRKGKYYYSYHTLYVKPVDKNNPDDAARQKSHLDYCMGNTVNGTFTYKGTMNNELGYGVKNGPKYPAKDYVVWRLNQSNHGGIVEFHGQDYLFYHNTALSSYKKSNFQNEGVWTMRSVCVDSLNYRPDGTIIPVKQTIECVAPVIVNQPFQIPLDLASATKTDVNVNGQKLSFTSNTATLRFDNVNLGSGYYYLDIKVNESVGNAKVQVRLDSPTGLLCGTIRLNATSETVNSGKIETFLREANGVHDVFLVFDLPGEYAQYDFEAPRFFAGSPVANGGVGSNLITNSSLRDNLNIYPNPSTGQFSIDLSNFGEKSLIEIYNLQGALVHSQQSEPTTVQISANNWKQGIYYIKAEGLKSTIVNKLVLK